MNILAINTAENTLCIALKYKGKLYEIKENNVQHSISLITAIDKLLKAINAKLNEMDLFGVVVGPGSFTGIRIGLATVKAFAYALNKNIVGVNSLEYYAYNSLSDFTNGKNIVSMLDAGSGLIYFAEYDNSLKEIVAPTAYTIEEAKKFSSGKNIVVQTLDKLCNAEFTNVNAIEFNNSKYIELIEKKAKLNCINTSKNIMPLYIRLSQAENDLIKKGKKTNV
ncbi:MAG: tRNA (adenosine(37)-N6)-threonylcarbamoyltransferase complex dimerization subunit type 1 TsaB [Clostridia bacterium]|jgi:tRNA threonylcarbamoyladenosine biosynthesis protein TsaB|nr:tRNA (adenosine(37)-N6)-threonylcarbamoyltransferase complex dimerization subunit type 1 TsaB [Clostridia bacterium]